MHFTTIALKLSDEFTKEMMALELTQVHHHSITLRKSWLIQPPHLSISPLSQKLYGISLPQLIDAPSFEGIWPEILPYLEGQIILCHKTAEILPILYKQLTYNHLSAPTLTFACTFMMSKCFYPQLTNHSLSSLKDKLHLSFGLGETPSQADLTALLMLHMAKSQALLSIHDLMDMIELKLGIMRLGESPELNLPRFISYVPGKFPIVPHKEVPTQPKTALETESLPYDFRGKVVCLTGPLETMVRTDAVKKLSALGAIYSSSVTSKTQVVLTNVKNPQLLPPDTLTSKLRRALCLKAEGQSIDILHEEAFLEALHDYSKR